jgi:hypothetical protein
VVSGEQVANRDFGRNLPEFRRGAGGVVQGIEGSPRRPSCAILDVFRGGALPERGEKEG